MVRPKKKKERSLFDSIRKPTPPPSRKFGEDKADEKVYPANRKIKHRKDGNLQQD